MGETLLKGRTPPVFGVQVSIGYMLNFNPWKLAVNLGTFERVRVAPYPAIDGGRNEALTTAVV